MPDRTELRMSWPGEPRVSLAVLIDGRPLTSEELRSVADVVEKIEDFRIEVRDELVEPSHAS